MSCSRLSLRIPPAFPKGPHTAINQRLQVLFIYIYIYISYGGFQKNRGPCLEVLMTRNIVYWGPFLGPSVFGNSHICTHKRTLVLKAIPGKAFGTRVLKSAAYEPFGLEGLIMSSLEGLSITSLGKLGGRLAVGRENNL